MNTLSLTPKKMQQLKKSNSEPLRVRIVFKKKGRFNWEGYLARAGKKQGTLDGEIINPQFSVKGYQPSGNFLMKDVFRFELI